MVLRRPCCPICPGRLDNLFEIPGGSRMASHLWPLRSHHPLAPVAKLRVSGVRGSHLPHLLMPFRPMTSFSFLHASTRDTSSS